MGSCLAYNFGPKELKEEMKGIKFFVYAPRFESMADGDQFFYTRLNVASTNYTSLVEQIRKALNLKPTVNDEYIFPAKLRLSFYYNGEENVLSLFFNSDEEGAAITKEQINVIKEADQKLVKENLRPAKIDRAQDVVFSEDHFFAKELSKPFKSKAGVYVPSQKEWIVGKTYKEAVQRFLESQKK